MKQSRLREIAHEFSSEHIKVYLALSGIVMTETEPSRHVEI